MNAQGAQQGYFWKLGILGLAYLLFEVFYTHYALFSVDDFWLAYHNNEYKNSLPYRDFLPYKTVLGYYVFLLPFTLFHGLFSPLIHAKLWIALINTFFIVATGSWLKKNYSPNAVITALLFIVPTQIFLMFSCEIRVDLLAFWFCLVSVLFLFDERYLLAGLCVALGFLICQKAVYYLIATNCGLVVSWFFNQRQWQQVRAIFIFNSAALLLIGVYLIFWASLSSLTTVIKSVFYEPYLISTVRWYLPYKNFYWQVIINANPGITLLWPFALFGLFILPAKNRIFIISYAVVILSFILTTRQPFPYFLLLAMPALLLVCTAFFSALYETTGLFSLLRRHRQFIRYFSLFYCVGLLVLWHYFVLVPDYCMVIFIPIVLYFLIFDGFDGYLYAFFTALFFGVILLVGFILPLLAFFKHLPSLDGRYQKSMAYLGNHLLHDGGSYVAGFPFLPHIKQSIPGLIHIVGPSSEYLKHPSKELQAIMNLSALYFSPVTTPQIIDAMDKAFVKFYADSARIQLLPLELKQYLASQFDHYWGSIFLYAPQVPAGRKLFQIKFAGQYRVKAAKNAIIYINHQQVTANKLIYLFSRQHCSLADSSYRLKLEPTETEKLLKNQFKANRRQYFVY